MSEAVDDDHVPGRGEEPVHDRGLRAPVQIVLEDHHGLGIPLGEGPRGGFEASSSEKGETEAVAFGDRVGQVRRLAVLREGPGDVRRGLDHIRAPEARPGDNQGPLGRAKSARDHTRLGADLIGEARDLRRGRIQLVGHGEAEPGDLLRGGVECPRGDLVEPSRRGRGEEERTLLVLDQLADGRVVPEGDGKGAGELQGLLADRFSERQSEQRGRVRRVLSQDEDRIASFHLSQRWGAGRAVPQDLEHQREQARLLFDHAQTEPLRPHESAQGEVRLQRGARGADADQLGRIGDQGRETADGLVPSDRLGRPVRPPGQQRPAKPPLVVGELVSVASAVAEEVAVDMAVVACPDAPQLPVALSRDRIAAEAAVNADGRSGLEVPLARVMALQRPVREHARRTHFHQVAGELAFEHALLMPPEVHMVARGESLQVSAAGDAAVEAHAPVALDAAVHLVVDEGAEVLVAVGALPEPEAAVVVPRHHRHVLQVALAPLVADGAVVGMVDHQPLDHLRAEGAGLGVLDRDPRPFRRRGHAGHHEPAGLVRLVAELLHRALPASPHGSHRGVPAEVGEVELERETDIEEVAGGVDLVRLPVDPDLRHQPDLRGQRFCRM